MPFKCGTLRCAIELERHPGCLSLAHRVIRSCSVIVRLLVGAPGPRLTKAQARKRH
jgi:hypothetical protein